MVESAAESSKLLTRSFVDLYPGEAAQILEEAPVEEIARLLASESLPRAVSLLSHINPQIAAECLGLMDDDAARRILPACDISRVASILWHLPSDARESRLSLLEERVAKELRQLMTYPAGTAGHVMDPRVASFPSQMTGQEVLARLHRLRQQRVLTLFLVDAQGRLEGALSLQDAILASPDQPLGDMIPGPPVSVEATASQEAIVEALANYRLSSLPVVDYDRRLIGTIRREAMMQAVQEEATAGMQTMVGVSKEERALSRPTFSVRKRLPWLNINLLTAFLAAAVVGLFENTIAQFTALAVLLPVVAGQSGNTGAQALAVTMRGLALREVRVRHWPRIMFKEMAVGGINGIAIAAVTMVGVYVWSGSAGLCMVIGVAMVMSMVIAGISGTAIPMVLTSLGQDPAQSSSIILTTVTDVVGFFSFLGLATIFAGLL